MISKKSLINIALPAMDELEYFPMFLECLSRQSFRNFKLWVCVNQPDQWWQSVDKLAICENNKKSIELLQTPQPFNVEVIDRSSKGRGWIAKKSGVGWARRVLMDAIADEADTNDLIVSLDVDTTYNPQYLESVLNTFIANPEAVALSVPYYHQLTGDDKKDRAILRYEIFMRYYALNLWRIQSPYSFTAIGSAIVLPLKSYRAIGGITPHKSGEDFYFLQKLRKYGNVLSWNTEKVYPAARYSTRVGFGTGPAMIKGSSGNWESYPLYPFEFFDAIYKTYRLFSDLFLADKETPLDNFLKEKFGESSIWAPLRKNTVSQKQFIRSCYHKLDAFRMLQYLKWKNDTVNNTDEKNLFAWMKKFYPEECSEMNVEKLSFSDSNIDELNRLRDFLVMQEAKHQKRSIIPEI